MHLESVEGEGRKGGKEVLMPADDSDRQLIAGWIIKIHAPACMQAFPRCHPFFHIALQVQATGIFERNRSKLHDNTSAILTSEDRMCSCLGHVQNGCEAMADIIFVFMPYQQTHGALRILKHIDILSHSERDCVGAMLPFPK